MVIYFSKNACILTYIQLVSLHVRLANTVEALPLLAARSVASQTSSTDMELCSIQLGAASQHGLSACRVRQCIGE